MRRTLESVVLFIGMAMSLPALAEGKKLTPKELQALLDSEYMAAGITDTGWAFMLVNHPGGKRDVYVNDFYVTSKTRKDISMVKGDQICSVRSDTNQERCFDYYHLGENRYESWLNGRRYTAWHLFRPK